MKILRTLALVTGLLLSTTLATAGEPITLYTGFQKGTYNITGEDLKKVCSKQLDITVEPGGSMTNLNALINEPVFKSGHRFALVQREVYDIVIGPVPKPKPVKRVMLLFEEEITILVNKSKKIKDLRDLAGRRVAAGSANAAPRRHRCAKVGLRGSTERSGHVGDYHGWARPGEECVSGAWG